ncbi:MAG: peptidase [Bacteroidetes bacterium]|nr:MAG: peptidase [Bacteroidota bacterium]
MNFLKFNLLIVSLCFLHGLMPFSATAGQQSNDQNSVRTDYSDHNQMGQRLRELTRAYPAMTNLQSLASTKGGKEIWLFTIGTGEITEKPAIAIVGGISGDHLLGSELALQMAERLLANSGQTAIKNLMDSMSFYIFPDMSPDARAQYFAPLRYERLGNANPADLDRDGRIGEDPFNDLNNDGMITMMRIKDPTGQWMKHPEDVRVMVKARPEKGERGEYLLFSEGIDEDKDGQFNEDGEEGVIFNRNFTFKYPHFTRGAGEHAVSEIETRAIADFLYEAKNVFAVISFGEANNLTDPISFNQAEANARIQTGWQKSDVQINEHVSRIYKQHLGDEAPKASKGSDGDFFQWAYYHYGRFSFSTPGWTVPSGEKTGSDEIKSDDLNFLRWAEDKGLENIFVPWQTIGEHPDFPGRTVEVGGIVPFAMKNPPYSMADTIAEKHFAFVAEVAALRPIIDIINIETERLGRNLHRITADIINKGTFPTASQTGEKVRWVQKSVLRLETKEGQSILSGKPVDILGAIEGRSSVQRSWLVRGSGTVVIRAGAEASGIREAKIDL